MRIALNEYIEQFKRRRKIHHRIISVLLVLSIIVSMTVTWQLHLTGVAQAGDADCGIEEHEHSEDCYALDRSAPLCGLEETSTEEMTEVETPEDGVEAESETETPSEPAHVHTDECYAKVLTCDKQVHVHTAECYPDYNADVEDASIWQATLPSSMTGTLSDRVVAVAKSQIGYSESQRNYVKNDKGERQGYTRYGEWYGNPYGDWSATFASFVLYYAGVKQSDVPYASGAQTWISSLSSLGLYESRENHTPQPGELVFFEGNPNTVGIVIAVSESTITTVEGDSDDSVRKLTHSISDSKILGYGMLEVPTEEEPETVDVIEEPEEELETVMTSESEISEPSQTVQTTSEPEQAAETNEPAAEPEQPNESETATTQQDVSITEAENVPETAENTPEALPAEPDTDTSLTEANGTVTVDINDLLEGAGELDEDALITSLADDSDRDGSSIAKAIDLPIDSSASTYTTGTTQVYYRIQPTKTAQYAMRSNLSSGDTYGYLYDSNGTQIISNDDGGGNTQFLITYTLEAGQTYYLGARWYHGTSNGKIPVSVTMIRDGSTMEDAYPLNLGSASNSVFGTDMKYYKIIPDQDRTYVLKSTNSSGDAVGTLFDENGNVIATNTGGQFEIQQKLKAGKTYYLGVNWTDSSKTDSMPVSVSYLEGSSIANAIDISVGQTLTDPVAGNNKLYYHIVASEDTGYSFKAADTLSSTVYFELYDKNGTRISSTSGTSPVISRSIKPDEDYYVAVYWSSSITGNVPVTLETFDDARTMETAIDLEITSLTDTTTKTKTATGTSNQEVYFKVTPQSTHEYTVTRNTGYIRIIRADGTVVSSKSSSNATVVLEEGQTYYIAASYGYDASIKTSGTISVSIKPTENHNYILQSDGKYYCSDYCPVVETLDDENGSFGQCGENATWRIEDGVLYIEGEGATYDFTQQKAPWYGFRNQFTKVVVGG